MSPKKPPRRITTREHPDSGVTYEKGDAILAMRPDPNYPDLREFGRKRFLAQGQQGREGLKFVFRRGLEAEATAANMTLRAGEIAVLTDTRRFKVGDGKTKWSNLPYAEELMPKELVDGFKFYAAG